MEELLQEFRNWNKDWNKYDKLRKWDKPLSREDFVKELENKYKVTKL